MPRRSNAAGGDASALRRREGIDSQTLSRPRAARADPDDGRRADRFPSTGAVGEDRSGIRAGFWFVETLPVAAGAGALVK